jgi:hypothetical protein
LTAAIQSSDHERVQGVPRLVYVVVDMVVILLTSKPRRLQSRRGQEAGVRIKNRDGVGGNIGEQKVSTIAVANCCVLD